jgi:hypothetical protein
MDELVRLVSERTGLSEENARVAVNVVVDYLKQKLPAPVAGQIDDVLEGGGAGLGDVAQGLGNLLGKR